jgi:ABC-type phosphate transport system substrate-binding protein
MTYSSAIYLLLARIGGACPVPGDVKKATRPVPSAFDTRLTPAIVVPIIVIALAWLVVSVPRWRQVAWRDQMDTPLDLLPPEARAGGMWVPWKVLLNQREVPLPSLVLLRVRNTGFTTIRKVGIRRPITFTFPGRDVVEYAVTDCRGIAADTIQPPGESELSVIGNRIILPRFPMRSRASFKLLVLLSGSGQGVLGKGRVSRGRVVHEARRRGPVARNVVFGTLLAVLAGAQAGVAFGEGPPIPSSCRGGHIAIEGSTAFAPAATQLAQAYTAVCRDASITVTANATFNGLDALSTPPSRKGDPPAVQIAMSDGLAPAGYSALVGHPVAVIVFAVVVNRQAGVFNLTTAQLRGIFAGKITNWRQVGGASMPVRIVARTSGSGTRHTFDSKVLGGGEPSPSSYDCVTRNALPSSPVIKCEVDSTKTLLQRVNSIPGAIGYAQITDASSYPNVERVKINGWDPDIGAIEGNSYPYWTVEQLYTHGQPPSTSLTAAFLSYMSSDTAKDILRSDAYTPCNDRAQPLVAVLCQG